MVIVGKLMTLIRPLSIRMFQPRLRVCHYFKGVVHTKSKSSHVLTLLLFQTYMTLFRRVQNDQLEDCGDHEITRLTEVFKLCST